MRPEIRRREVGAERTQNPTCVFRSPAHSVGGIDVSKDDGTLAEIVK